MFPFPGVEAKSSLVLCQFWLSGAVCQLRRRRDKGWKVDRPYHPPNG
ncbi:hypothetical protein QUB60_12380 [Microcoleus sp. A2-C5]